MPSVETGQTLPQEAIPPRQPGELGQATRVEVDLGNWNPTPETVKSNWELLGQLPAKKDEDIPLEFIRSLGQSNEVVNARGKEALAKKNDPANPDATAIDKMKHIIVLRKMVRGHDWRAADVAKLADEYISEKIETTERDIEKLKMLPPEQMYLVAIKKLEQNLGGYQKDKANLEAIIQAGYGDLLKKPQPESMPADLERLGFESISVKGEIIYFKTIAGRHSWNSGLVAAGNELKEGLTLGLKIKYPSKLQALHLLEKVKSNLPNNTSVGTFIDEPGGYMILHGDSPRTNTTAADRSLNYANTEIMVFVVPDDEKITEK